MTTILLIADDFRRVLVPFLIGAALVFSAMLILLVVQRWVRGLINARQARLAAHWQPEIQQVLDEGAAMASTRLLRITRRSPLPMGRLLAAPLASLIGSPVVHAAEFARLAGLDQWWTRQTQHRSWWRRAEAVRALGLIEDSAALHTVIGALEDNHEEVRAAAVDSLGRLRDARAVTPLLDRLPDESRHQRVRVIDALRQIGAPVAEPLLIGLRARPALLVHVADLVPAVCGGNAADDLLQWTSNEEPEVRAAALLALGRLGLDDLSYYHALKALGDEDARVRAMAARALGRSGRLDAALYLAARLDDDWVVAAESARALGTLKDTGRRLLDAKSTGVGLGADLARQALWELDNRRVPHVAARA